MFSLAYPSGATYVQVLKGTSILANQNISYGLLLTAVQNLQDAAFVANPTQYRTALLNMVNPFNLDPATGNKGGTYNELTRAIGPSISSWPSTTYVAPNPLFYTKVSLLNLVNGLSQRLAPAK